jgi:benzoylformate decarboxylase
MYGIQALWTAAREQLPVTFVILDNSQYAALRILAEVGGGKMPGIDLGGIDFVALAQSMGCAAHLVRDDFRARLEQSLVDDQPTLLHVPVIDEHRTLY